DLRFVPAHHVSRRTPRLLDALPLPMRAAHANAEVTFDGWIEVDGLRRALHHAPGTQVHLYGTRQVEELLWLYGVRFEEDVGAGLEAVSVRAKAGTPAVTSVWLRAGGQVRDRTGLAASL